MGGGGSEGSRRDWVRAREVDDDDDDDDDEK